MMRRRLDAERPGIDTPLPWFSACPDWPRDRLPALEWLCDNGIETSRADFLTHVHPGRMRALERQLGYRADLKMEEDWHVRYFRSPDGAARWVLHSAVEYVFSSPDNIAAIQDRALKEEDAMMSMDRIDTLVLVHPGSLFGSAEANVGRKEARAAREEIFATLDGHEGSIIVIDGMLSDEIAAPFEARIEAALARSRAGGFLAIRAWGCDAGEGPNPAWLVARVSEGVDPIVAGGQQEVIGILARDMADHLEGMCFGVTGAWASRGDSGCVNSVVEALEASGFAARILPCALMEPDEEPDDPDRNDAEPGPDPA